MNWLRRWRRKTQTAAPPDPDFAYRLAWTKETRTWESGKRAVIAESLGHVLRSGGFLPNAFDRRYQVPGLDDSRHSGASLVALRDVLEALEHDSQ